MNRAVRTRIRLDSVITIVHTDFAQPIFGEIGVITGVDNVCFDKMKPKMFMTFTYAVLNGGYANYDKITECVQGVSKFNIQYLFVISTGNVTLAPIVQSME